MYLERRGCFQKLSTLHVPKKMQFVDVTDDSVDGRNPKQPPGMYKTLVNNGENLPVNSTGERRISEPSTGIICDRFFSPFLHFQPGVVFLPFR